MTTTTTTTTTTTATDDYDCDYFTTTTTTTTTTATATMLTAGLFAATTPPTDCAESVSDKPVRSRSEKLPLPKGCRQR